MKSDRNHPDKRPFRHLAAAILASACLSACAAPSPTPVSPEAPVDAAPTLAPTDPPTQPVEPSATPEPDPIVFDIPFGGSGTDQGIGINLTADGGFILVGFTTPEGRTDQDVYLVRTDGDGRMLWSQTYGGEADDSGWAVLETEDGGFILAGFTNSFGAGGTDVYVIRTDASGQALSEHTFGGTGDDIAWALITVDGGYLLAGETSSMGSGQTDAYFIRLDHQGGVLWEQAYGGSRVDRVFSARQTADGGFVAAGVSNSFNGTDRDAYIIKTDLAGNLQWETLFGEELDDVAHSVHLAGDGSYFITGYTRNFGASDNDALILSIDPDGNIVRQKTFGGRLDDRLITGSETADGGGILVGYTKSFGAGNWDVYLVRVNASGEVEWFLPIGGEGEDTGYTVRQTRDGDYVLAGYTRSQGAGSRDAYLVRVTGP